MYFTLYFSVALQSFVGKYLINKTCQTLLNDMVWWFGISTQALIYQKGWEREGGNSETTPSWMPTTQYPATNHSVNLLLEDCCKSRKWDSGSSKAHRISHTVATQCVILCWRRIKTNCTGRAVQIQDKIDSSIAVPSLLPHIFCLSCHGSWVYSYFRFLCGISKYSVFQALEQELGLLRLKIW